VLTVPGSGFGMPGHIRISLTVERDTVVRALPGFERAFRKAKAGQTEDLRLKKK
jgi:aspartate aminotransferase